MKALIILLTIFISMLSFNFAFAKDGHYVGFNFLYSDFKNDWSSGLADTNDNAPSIGVSYGSNTPLQTTFLLHLKPI
jgi:hypothetical protein